MKGARRAAVALVLAMSWAGCDGGTSISNPNDDTTVRYQLRAVDKRQVPVLMQNEPGARVELSAGELVLRDERFTQNLEFSESVPAGTPATQRKSYSQGRVSVSGDHIRFEVDGGGSFEGTITETVIEYTIQGNTGPIDFTFSRK